MNPAKCDDFDYIHFLIASADVFTCTEAAKCQPLGVDCPSHDAFTRLLQRQPLDTDALWNEVLDIVQPQDGFLVIDDSTLTNLMLKIWTSSIINGAENSIVW